MDEKKDIVEWKDSYRVGDVFIDSEHQILFKIANYLLKNRGNIEHPDIKRYIQLIFQYTKVHFQHEESLLREIEWEDYSAHRREHQQIVEEMKHTLIYNRDISVLQHKLARFLQSWVFSHIIDHDSAFRDTLINKKGFMVL
ncbi:MAG: hemerythrin domain-containing protein [Fibrobacterota bacterium]